MANLENKVAVITGRNSGIGYATAKKLSKDGVQVIITGRRKEAIEKAASALNVTGILALELAPRKIRVNAVSPGPIAAEIMGKIGLDPAMEAQMIPSIPLSRFGTRMK